MEDKIAIVVNALLYILKKFDKNTTDSHQLFKILYFAEQKHLVKYGKTITDDRYAAMKYGPVPSFGLNLVRSCSGETVTISVINDFSDSFSVNGYEVTAEKEIDLDWLSRSELACIDESFEENKNLSFQQLTKKSHDSAWDSATHFMDFDKIAVAGGADDNMITYILSKKENQHLSF